MKFKVKLLLFTLILGCSCLASAYSDVEDPTAEGYEASANLSSSNEAPEVNEEIYDPALLQQQVEEAKKILHDLDLEMETETEVSTKTVRNVSDNQLNAGGGYGSGENSQMPSGEDYENEYNFKSGREGRLLPSPPPTHIPDYVRQQMKPQDDSQEHLNLSQSPEYMDEGHNEPQHLRSSLQTATIDYEQPQSKENEDIVPLAMRYYDDDGDDEDAKGGVTAAALHDTSGSNNNHTDNDEDDDYHESGVVGETNRLNNGPVPMPQQQPPPPQPQQQQWPQQRSFALPNEASSQNSSEEYYDEEVSSREDELMATTTAPALPAATPTPTTSSQSSSDSHPTMVILAAGFPLAYQPTTSAPGPDTRNNNGPPAPPQPLMTPASPTLGPTTPPYPMIASAVAAAAALPANTSSGDKKGKQIPIVATTTTASTATTSTSTTTSTTTSKTLPANPPPQPPPTTSKTINAVAGTSRRHLLPHEQLRNYIEDAYIRMPLAVIVDPSAESLEKTKALWNEALRANLNIKIILVTLNESDIPAAFNFNNSRQFLTGLNSIKEHEGGDAFRGISHAAELVPYDSAVFISTATLANHTDQVHDAAITLLKKRIRLYLIWFGERALSENETQETVGGILGEVAIRSGGEVLHIVGNENSMELEGSTLTIVADALRGSQELDVPVDTTLSSLHVKIDKLMRRAVLETPNGG
uniref:VWFA domain-containing protein n=1 Tax=Musca domestica TaxID=7370 RepID=T1PAI3_MUSDO